MTSTIATHLLREVRASLEEEDEIALLSMLGYSNRSEPVSLLSRDQLLAQTNDALKEQLRQRGLSTSGPKGALVDRLLASPVPSANVFAKLMEKWFMKPYTSSHMKLGSVNEPNVRKALPDFFKNYGQDVTFLGVAERGLLRKQSAVPSAAQSMATSLDGLVVLKLITDSPDVVCALEIKSMTANNSVQDANDRLIRACNATACLSQRLFVATFREPLFKKLVWTTDYRAQVMHHLAVTSLKHCLFVVADQTHIIYAVLVSMEDRDLQLYENIISRVSQTHLSYFLNPDIGAEIALQPNEFGHAIDLHTVKIWKKLQQAIDQKRAAGQMLGPVQHFVPFAVSQWNHCKGGQDVCSRILKNVKVDFRSLTPRAFIIIRFIMVALMNSHMIYRLLRHEDRLDSFQTYKHLKDSLNKDGAFSNFLTKFAQEWTPSVRFVNHVNDATTLGLNQQESNVQPWMEGNLEKAPKRNRMKWLNSPTGISTRLSSDVYHQRVSLPRKECPICGTQTTVACTICGLHVCGEKASGQRRSCWDLVHTAKRLEKRERPARDRDARGRRGRNRSSTGTLEPS